MKSNLKWHAVALSAATLPLSGVAWAQASSSSDPMLPSSVEVSPVAAAPPTAQTPSQVTPSQVTPAAAKHAPLPPLPSHAPSYARPHEVMDVHRSTGVAHTPGIVSSLAGAWIHSTALGPVWIPQGTTTTLVGGVPYAHLYMPSHGWGWHPSPWGPGAFREAPSMVRPWVSSGWGGSWISHPGVVLRIDF